MYKILALANSRYIAILFYGLMFVFFSSSSFSQGIPNCKNLATQIEIEEGLPKGILTSISLVESGRVLENGSLKAWPWSLNHAGKSLFFDSKIEALDYLEKHITSKFRNIDVGCMQVNVRWHFEKFGSYERMLDPITNIRYAASFLSDLKRRHGSWENAIKHYHSSTRKLHTKYLAKVNKVWSRGIGYKKDDSSSIRTTSLFLDKNIFYQQQNENLIKNTSIKSNEKPKSGDSGLEELVKVSYNVNENQKNFRITFSDREKNHDRQSLKDFLKYKPLFLKKNIDMILLFRNEFSQGN